MYLGTWYPYHISIGEGCLLFTSKDIVENIYIAIETALFEVILGKDCLIRFLRCLLPFCPVRQATSCHRCHPGEGTLSCPLAPAHKATTPWQMRRLRPSVLCVYFPASGATHNLSGSVSPTMYHTKSTRLLGCCKSYAYIIYCIKQRRAGPFQRAAFYTLASCSQYCNPSDGNITQ